MRKYSAALAIVGLAVWLVFVAVAAIPAPARAQDTSPAAPIYAIPPAASEQIRNFSAVIQLQKNGDLRVTETIAYDFTNVEHHGIYRDIPLAYGGGNLYIYNIEVSGPDPISYQFIVSNEGGIQRIKIGDPNITITGLNTYVIGYWVSGATQWLAGNDQIVWNVTGNQWQVHIDLAHAQIVLPDGVAPDQVSFACYEGPYGATEPCVGNAMDFNSAYTLGVGYGLTVSMTLPKGVLTPPSLAERILNFILNYWMFLIPVIVFIICFKKWWRQGRDPKGRGTIIAQYEPPSGLLPLEMGILLKGMKPEYASAEIVSLAVRGYLKIIPNDDSNTPKDYTFEKLKDLPADAAEFDRALMQGIFAAGPNATMSGLKATFLMVAALAEKAAINSLIAKGYYDKSPKKIMREYILSGFAVAFVGFFLGSLSPLLTLCLVFSGIIVIIFGFIMPRVTQKGALEKENIRGFKEYLNIAEKDRINFHDAPQRTAQLFETFLPYAIALGVVTAWAKEFEGIYTQPPKWYGGNSGTFVIANFANNMQSFSKTSAQSMFAASSGGSGGGFSGGGGGGGGGGSW